MNKSILSIALTATVVFLGAPRAHAGFGLPSMLGGGGGGMDAMTEQAKVQTVNSIFSEVGKNAFEGGKLLLSKQKWACDKLAKADLILAALNQPGLLKQSKDLKVRLFCGVTEMIPDSMLAPEKPKEDSQKT